MTINTVNINGLILKSLRLESGLQQDQAAEKYNEFKELKEGKVYDSDVSKYEGGKKSLSDERLLDFAQAIKNISKMDAQQEIALRKAKLAIANLDDDSLRKVVFERTIPLNSSSSLHEERLNLHPSNLIPVYSSVGAGFQPDSIMEIVEHFPNLTSFPNSRVFGAIVKGDSMAPTIQSGDRVIILKDGFGKIEDGQLYVFWIDEEFTVKRVEKPEGNDLMFLLISDNEKYGKKLVTLKEENVSCVGKVLEIHHIVK